MAEKVRVGLVGTSWFAEMFHLANLKKHPSAEVVAICGRRLEYTNEVARKHGIRQAFDDYEAMILYGNLDAVVVSVPDDLHYPITMAALDAGKHVFCEKPLSLTADQAREMATNAEAKGVVHLINYIYRWMPNYLYMKQLVKEGYIGKSFYCLLRLHFGAGRGGEYNWRFDRRRSNGTLAGFGSHMIDLARWLVDEIEWVSASLGYHIEREGVQGEPIVPANDTAILNLGFRDGSQGDILLSAVSHLADRGSEHSVSLYGQAGSLEGKIQFFAPHDSDPRLLGARSTEDTFSILSIPSHHSKGVDLTSDNWFFDYFSSQSVADRLFIDAILEGRKVTPNFNDGLWTMEVIDAAIKSDRTERRVHIRKNL